MADLYNASGSNVGIVDSDGTVYSASRDRLGRVLNGEVYDREGSLVGRYDDKYVYEGTSRIGVIQSDGKIYDYRGNSKGKVVGGDIESGGAALLLLFQD